MSNSQAKVEELFAQWQRLRAKGQAVSAAKFCQNCPELLRELEKQIDAWCKKHGRTEEANRTLAPTSGSSHQSEETRATPAPAADKRKLKSPAGADLTFLEPAQSADEIGRIGSYRILSIIGQGGMGLVLRAEDTVLQRLVAIKVIKASILSLEARQRFLQEARSAAKLEHDHIVSIYHIGETSGGPYLVMPLLQGTSLDRYLQLKGRPSLEDALRIGQEVAEGLAAAHSSGLIHRDIKPANIWLKAPDDTVVLLDFGLARSQFNTEELTQVGQILGTPGYMAPEQAAGKKVDRPADQFSLGCVMYELVTGKRPFTGTTAVAVLHQVATHQPPSTRQLNPEVPGEVADFIEQLLAKSPEDRPTARAAAELFAAMSSTSISSSATKVNSPRRFVPWLLIGGIASLFFCGLLVLAGIGVWMATRASTKTPDVAHAAVASPPEPTQLEAKKPLDKTAFKIPPVGWEEYRSVKGRFKIWLPGLPEVTREKVGDQEFDKALLSVPDKATVYTVTYSEHSDRIFPDPVAALISARDGGMSKVNATIIADQEIKLGDHPGRDFTFEIPTLKGLQGRARYYLVGRRLHQLMILAPKERLTDKDSGIFFDSFEFLPNN